MLAKLAALFVKAKLFVLTIPFMFSVAGGAMNQAVLIANGGKFPVMLNENVVKLDKIDGEYLDEIHCLMSDKTKLNFLADIFDTHVRVISPGDILIELGDLLLTYSFTVWATLVVVELNKQPAKS